jgi:hypothetical protein
MGENKIMVNIKKLLLIMILIVVLMVVFVTLLRYTPFGSDHAVEEAERLVEDGDYAAAWRVLYDRMGPSYDGRQAAKALDRLEWNLLHDDRSALMQEFRDPHRSILEKRKIASEIVEVVEENRTAQSSLLNNHDDPFVQVMLSSQLSPDEKIELIIRIRSLVEKHYITSGQQEDLRKQVYQFQTLAEEQLHQGQYREAFTTLREADHIVGMLPYFEHDVMELIWEAVELYLQNDPTPLTRLLRDSDVSFLDKRAVLIELEKLLHRPDAFREIVIRKQRYTGSFIELIRDSDYKTGSLIWIGLKDSLEKEDVYVGNKITPDLARSVFPDHDHLPVFPPETSFHSLHVKYSKDSVLVSLQGKVPQQHLQEFYMSLGFRPEMFTSQLKYADKNMLSHYWNVTLKNVRFADFVIEETKEKVCGAFVFAYQEGEQGEVQFYLSYYTS